MTDLVSRQVLLLLLCMIALPAGAQNVTLEPGTSRHGTSYRTFGSWDRHPEVCRTACARDRRCKGFHWEQPSAPGAGGRCHLRDTAPPAQLDACCVSGVKGPGEARVAAPGLADPPHAAGQAAHPGDPDRELRMVEMQALIQQKQQHVETVSNVARPSFSVTAEAATNRFGSDYHGFEMSSPNPDECRLDCLGDAGCLAYSFVKPGLQGPHARCWLKNAVPSPTADACCVSGTKKRHAPQEKVLRNIR